MQDPFMVRDSLNKLSRMNKLNQWLFKTIEPFIGNRILEAGCGNGNITSFLNDRELVIAVDNDMKMIEDITKRLSKYKNLKFMKFDITNDELVNSIKNNKIDTILCLNTLEHIENDIAVLNNFYHILEDKGKLVLLVPSIKYLYSSLDKIAGHFRRYSKKEIINKLRKSNFFILHINYFNIFGTLGWFFQGKILKRKELSYSLLNLFDNFVNIFIIFEKILRLPIGLSLIAVCQKIDSSQ